jgi:hypothetical protein
MPKKGMASRPLLELRLTILGGGRAGFDAG